MSPTASRTSTRRASKKVSWLPSSLISSLDSDRLISSIIGVFLFVMVEFRNQTLQGKHPFFYRRSFKSISHKILYTTVFGVAVFYLDQFLTQVLAALFRCIKFSAPVS